jgi:hypothetical protein
MIAGQAPADIRDQESRGAGKNGRRRKFITHG